MFERFLWGPGDGNRIHAPGFPDTIAAVGGICVWTNRCGLWFWLDDDVRLYSLGEVMGIVVSPAECVVVSASGSDFAVHVINGESGVVEMSGPYVGRGVEVGIDLLIIDQGTERVAVGHRTDESIALPVGARDSRPKPWAYGLGVVWVDQRQVYRFAIGGKIQSVGRLDASPDSWIVGPHGSAVFECDGRTFGMAPTSGLVQLPSIDLATVRFNRLGDELLAVSDEGTLLVRLYDGEVLRRSRGHGLPVGFHEGPVILDEDIGSLKYLGGPQIRDGFAPCAVSLFDGRLYGPGGTAWNLRTQERLWKGAPLGAMQLVAHAGGVFQIDERIVGLNQAGGLETDVPFPVDEEMDGEVFRIEYDGEGFDVHTDQGIARLGLTGERISFQPWTEDSLGEECFVDVPEVEAVNRPWIVGVDGSWSDGARQWCWSEDGMLISLVD